MADDLIQYAKRYMAGNKGGADVALRLRQQNIQQARNEQRAEIDRENLELRKKEGARAEQHLKLEKLKIGEQFLKNQLEALEKLDERQKKWSETVEGIIVKEQAVEARNFLTAIKGRNADPEFGDWMNEARIKLNAAVDTPAAKGGVKELFDDTMAQAKPYMDQYAELRKELGRDLSKYVKRDANGRMISFDTHQANVDALAKKLAAARSVLGPDVKATFTEGKLTTSADLGEAEREASQAVAEAMLTGSEAKSVRGDAIKYRQRIELIALGEAKAESSEEQKDANDLAAATDKVAFLANLERKVQFQIGKRISETKKASSSDERQAKMVLLNKAAALSRQAADLRKNFKEKDAAELEKEADTIRNQAEKLFAPSSQAGTTGTSTVTPAKTGGRPPLPKLGEQPSGEKSPPAKSGAESSVPAVREWKAKEEAKPKDYSAQHKAIQDFAQIFQEQGGRPDEIASGQAYIDRQINRRLSKNKEQAEAGIGRMGGGGLMPIQKTSEQIKSEVMSEVSAKEEAARAAIVEIGDGMSTREDREAWLEQVRSGADPIALVDEIILKKPKSESKIASVSESISGKTQ